MTGVSDTGGYSRSFGYDQWGNIWVLPGYTGLSPAGPTSDVYNGNNQINGISYDMAGNQLSVNGDTLSYDAENRQIQVTEPPSLGNATESYYYDGNGQRVQKSGPAGTTVYVYDGFGQLAAEYSTDPGGSPCTTCYLSYDHLGSVRLVTDQNANVVSRHDYLPFGEEIPGGTAGRTGQWEAADNTSQRFTGQIRDSETGEDFFNARYFTAALGRFNSPDPMNIGADLANPQSWNGHAYVWNNPMALVDPSGLAEQAGGGGSSGGGSAPSSPDPCMGALASSDGWLGSNWIWPPGSPLVASATACEVAQQNIWNSGGGGGQVGGGGANSASPQPQQPLQPPNNRNNTKNLACSADVAVNFGLGFIPGYNAAKVGAALLGINFNPVEGALGYKSIITGLPSPAQAAAGATSAYSLYRWAVFDVAGGASALNKLTDLAGRASFAAKSASAQASLLGKISSLSNLSKIASSAGTVANLLNVASAGFDLHNCWSQP